MDTPNFVKLEMAPKVIEERLKTGLWLILVAAIWSGPDLREIDRAVRFAARRTDVMVGIRRFNDSAETAAWLPEVPVTPGEPDLGRSQGRRGRPHLGGTVHRRAAR